MKSKTSVVDVTQTPARNPSVIHTKAKKGILLVWMLVSFWSLFAFPFAISMLAHIPAFGPVWLVLVFPLLGVVLLIWALRLSWRLLRFGEYSLAMHPTDTSLGTRFEGTISLGRTLPANPAFIVSLVCDQVDQSGEDARDIRIWQQEQLADLLGRSLTFSFVPPENLPASEPESRLYHRWQIRMQSLGNDRIEASFDITLNAAHAFATTISLSATQPRCATKLAIPANVATLQQTNDGFEIDYPPQRHGASIALVVGGLATVPAWLLVANNEPLGWVISIWFGLLGLGIIALGIHVLTYRLHVTIKRTWGESNSRWLFGNTHDNFSSQDVLSLIPLLTSNTKGNDAYKIEARLTDGRRVELGHGIPNSLATQAIMQRIATALDLDDSLLAPVEYAAANAREKPTSDSPPAPTPDA